MGEGGMQIDMSLKKRLAYMFLGIFGMGIFLSFLLKVGYGTDTSSFMNSSVAAKFGISLGTTLVCTNALFLVPEIIWGRKLIGIGTIANMISAPILKKNIFQISFSQSSHTGRSHSSSP